jgi:hypothetical protein
MELIMKPTIETVGKLLIKLLIFVFLLGATFVALPYATHQTYTESSSVWTAFPIAIFDNGTARIVDWYSYKRNVDLYKDKIISAQTQKEYKLSEDGSFELRSAPNNVLKLHIFDGDWHYWAKYSVSNGIVKPISCRIMTPSVMFISFAVALIGTPLIVWAYKRYKRGRST